MQNLTHHLKYMAIALEQAKLAYEKNEVPIGCVIVKEGQIIAKSHNLKETLGDTTAHCEILAIKTASQYLNNWRLANCDVYTTVEPCIMCAGALIHARVANVYYGCKDEKFGGLGSLYNFAKDTRLNHKIEYHQGFLEQKCKDILIDFFRKRRLSHKNGR